MTSTYVDLNSVRAGMVDRPERTSHGSISERAAIVADLPRRTNIRMTPPPCGTDEAYLEHVDAWGRWQQSPGKASRPTSLPPILDRLELSARRWLELFSAGWETLRGTAIGTADSKQREANRRRSRWVIDPLTN